jgi:hypothetical protein
LSAVPHAEYPNAHPDQAVSDDIPSDDQFADRAVRIADDWPAGFRKSLEATGGRVNTLDDSVS